MPKRSLKQKKSSEKMASRPLISKCGLRHLIKVKLTAKSLSCRNYKPKQSKIGCLVDEQALTCAVCLQLLLRPVLTQCGHTFCLSCAENLALHQYSCAICHDHEPTYSLHHSASLQKLVNLHLEGREQEYTLDYHLRNQKQEQKWMERAPGMLTEGMQVDYWSDRQAAWKVGIVQGITKTGEAFVRDTKTGDTRLFDSCSRALAKLHYFTKEEVREPRRELPAAYRNLPFIAGNDVYNPMRAQRMGNFMLYMPEAIQPFEPWNIFFPHN